MAMAKRDLVVLSKVSLQLYRTDNFISWRVKTNLIFLNVRMYGVIISQAMPGVRGGKLC